MLCYILITYRQKASQSLRDHPQAKAQIDYYERVLDGNRTINIEYAGDVARTITGLASLPMLSDVLFSMREQARGKILFRDLTLLFRYTRLNKRDKFFHELTEFGVQIFSIRHKKTLSEFSQKEVHDLILHPDSAKFPPKLGTTHETESARMSSLISRKRKSISTARAIQKVKDELKDREGRATLQMIASEADARGIRTTRGVKWTAQNVDRILKLLEQAELEE